MVAPSLVPPAAIKKDMDFSGIFSALGSGISAYTQAKSAGANSGQSAISGVLGAAVSMGQSSVSGTSANGIVAPAKNVNGQMIVQPQTQGSGIWSDINGFIGGLKSVVSNGQVVPKVAGAVAAQSGTAIPLGSGVSFISPSLTQSPATQPVDQTSGSNSMMFEVILFVGGLLLLAFKFFKSGRK